jgi:Ca-activated chloride channel family protein
MIRFDMPFAFLLLVVIPVLVYLFFRKQGRAGLHFSSIRNARRVKASLRQRLIFIPLALRIAALILLVIALARPQEGSERIHDVSKGVAIEMVVDRSSSMSALKDFGRQTLSRLDVVKQVFKEFIMGNSQGLAGRPNDLIGMISFARYADTLCPLTLSHDVLLGFIDNINTVKIESEDGTSIGDAIARAAARLQTLEQTITRSEQQEQVDYEIKSKIIILLTDGEDTGIGRRTPLAAAELAKNWGIKIYTVGISGKGWYVEYDTIFGKRKLAYQSDFRTTDLEKIAKLTGGISRQAGDIDSLRDVYQEIDTLEKSEIESIRYLDYKELFFVFALFGLILLAIEFILNNTVWRRIP